jgi:hypothetical protein
VKIALLDRLVTELSVDGDLTPEWRNTFLAVPRHLFIPDIVWEGDPAVDGPYDLVPVHRHKQPQQWWEIAYANRAVVVQVDDGHPVGPDRRGRDISSSAKRILTPWANAYFDGGLLALESHGDGSATGRIVAKAWFMWLRDQRLPRVSVGRFIREDQRTEATTTEVHPYEVAGDYDAQLAISLRVPGCHHLYWRPDDDDDHGTLWLIDPLGSWASLRHHPEPDGPYEVHQHGLRRLWDEVEAAYHWWRDAGNPKAADWRFTITPDAQRVELTTE